VYGCCCRSDTFEYLEDFPINLLHELPERTGHSITEPGLIVVVLEYGANYSAPGKDVFRRDRATGDAEYADLSNFLHPVFYYYQTLPTGIQGRGQNTLSWVAIAPSHERRSPTLWFLNWTACVVSTFRETSLQQSDFRGNARNLLTENEIFPIEMLFWRVVRELVWRLP